MGGARPQDQLTGERGRRGRVRGAVPAQPGRSGGVLAGRRARHRLADGAVARPRRRGGAALPLVPGRGHEHLSQRPRPPRRRRPRRPGGPHPRLAGDRRGPVVHLRRAARPRGSVRGGHAAARGGRGRHGRDLHADGPRGRRGDARLRPAGRGPLGRLRRLRPPGARGADRRRQAGADRDGLLRHRGAARRRLHAAAELRPRAGGEPAGALHRAPAAPVPGRADAGARPGVGRGARGRRAGRARAGEGDGSALHPLHLGHHRDAEGRRARQRRPRRRDAVVDGERLRRPGGRGLVHRLGHRLGGGPLVHRLRAPDHRLHDGDVRGQAGRHARRRGVLARDRRPRGEGALHGADRLPGDQEGGPRTASTSPVTTSPASAASSSPASASTRTPTTGRATCSASRSSTTGGRPRPAGRSPPTPWASSRCR